jgi:hypothetical protein
MICVYSIFMKIVGHMSSDIIMQLCNQFHLQRMNTIYVLCVGDRMFQITISLKYTI